MKSVTSSWLVRISAVASLAALVACSGASDSSKNDSTTEPKPSSGDTSTSKQLTSAPLPGADGTPGSGTPGSATSGGVTSGSATPGDSVVDPTTGKAVSKEQLIATKLGAPSRFLIGVGNDGNGSGASHRAGYELGKPIDIHYMYLSNMDWPTWNTPVGAYVGLEAAAAKAHGAIPMFTLYQAASNGDGNIAPLGTDAFMTKYWANVRVLFAQLDAFGDAAILHVEPDFWGYAQKHSNDPAGTPIKVNNLVPECKDLPNDVSGFGKCIIRLSRQLAPNVVVGLSASAWGSTENGDSQPDKITTFMKAVGADEADILVLETLDRDAGCFEADTDPNCKRSGKFYWDESNVAHPNFHDHLAWAKSMRAGVGLPLLWWQMPLGVPSSSSGGSALKYRDNRVHYLFSHPEEFAAAGGIGAVFGTGAANQTTVQSDGGQFKTALASYLATPAPLN